MSTTTVTTNSLLAIRAPTVPRDLFLRGVLLRVVVRLQRDNRPPAQIVQVNCSATTLRAWAIWTETASTSTSSQSRSIPRLEPSAPERSGSSRHQLTASVAPTFGVLAAANNRIGEAMAATGHQRGRLRRRLHLQSNGEPPTSRIFLGSTTGISSDRQLLAEGNTSEHLGFRLAAGSGVNGDGLNDLFFSMRSVSGASRLDLPDGQRARLGVHFF